MFFTRTARTAVVAAISAATLATTAHPATATHHSPTDDLTATPCKIDTAPGAPSCAGEEYVAIKLNATTVTATPCKLDTSPNYPSCTSRR